MRRYWWMLAVVLVLLGGAWAVSSPRTPATGAECPGTTRPTDNWGSSAVYDGNTWRTDLWNHTATGIHAYCSNCHECVVLWVLDFHPEPKRGSRPQGVACPNCGVEDTLVVTCSSAAEIKARPAGTRPTKRVESRDEDEGGLEFVTDSDGTATAEKMVVMQAADEPEVEDIDLYGLVFTGDMSDLIIPVRYPGYHVDEGEHGWYVEVRDIEAVVRRVMAEEAQQ